MRSGFVYTGGSVQTSDSLLFSLLLAAVLSRFPEEADLIARLRARDPDALAELYDRYGRVVFSLILRVVRDRATAEDLVQEAFLRVWNRVGAFDAQKGALGPWLLTVARNQALDYARSVEGRAWSTMMTADTERPSLFCEIEGDILNSVQLDRLRVALAKLTPQQRQIIELAYFEGLSQTEMAERLSQPLGTVKTWMRTALRTLREQSSAPAQV